MQHKLKNYLNYFLILIYVSGAIGFIIKPSFFAPYTPLTLLITTFVFLIQQPIQHRKYLLTFAAVALLGFVTEWFGIRTGLVFGNYYYGEALGYKLFGVPLIISLNWALLVTAGMLVSTLCIHHVFITPIISSLMITGIDFVIEQSAGQLDFWHFSTGSAGVHNYVGWFLVSLVASFLFYNVLSHGNRRNALLILSLQILFFSSLLFLNFIPYTPWHF